MISQNPYCLFSDMTTFYDIVNCVYRGNKKSLTLLPNFKLINANIYSINIYAFY